MTDIAGRGLGGYVEENMKDMADSEDPGYVEGGYNVCFCF